ncbi:MAG: hypothetical protein ACI3VR_04565 [Intestinibacter sp.]|uniref:hypothetical protein n=1 Tax=Intestinibacter sp. TaxID=1965304 RepID=UPI003F150847
MKDFFSLKILDLFKPLFKKFGVEYDKMRLIVKTKLTLDKRRGGSSNGGKNTFSQSLILYCVVGLFCSIILFTRMDMMTKMTTMFAFISVMLLTSFISDFSSVILDTSDKDIIGVTDVKQITLNMAKIVHVIIYISILSLAISGFSLIASLFTYNIGFCLLFILCIIFIDFLLIMVTSVLYYVLIKIFKGERLKDILNLFQVFMVLLFFVMYYIMSSSFGNIDFNYVYKPGVYSLFIPFMWFASLFCVIFGGKTEALYIVMSVLAVVVPILMILLYVKLTPTFEKNLEKLDRVSYNKGKTKKSFASKLSEVLCKSNEERAFFNFIYNNLSRDREFKTRAYPTLATAALMPFILLFASYDKGMGIMNYINYLSKTNNFLNIYVGIIVIQNCILLLKYSKEYEASFIYDVLPIGKKGNVYSAEFKVIIIKLFIPIFLVIGVPYMFLFKIGFIKHLLIAFVSTIFISMGTFRINEKVLPFSEDYAVTANSANFINVIKSVVFVGIFTLLHYVVAVRLGDIFSLVYLALLILLMVISWNKVFDVNQKGASSEASFLV